MLSAPRQIKWLLVTLMLLSCVACTEVRTVYVPTPIIVPKEALQPTPVPSKVPVTYLELKQAPADWALALGNCNIDKETIFTYVTRYNAAAAEAQRVVQTDAGKVP